MSLRSCHVETICCTFACSLISCCLAQPGFASSLAADSQTYSMPMTSLKQELAQLAPCPQRSRTRTRPRPSRGWPQKCNNIFKQLPATEGIRGAIAFMACYLRGHSRSCLHTCVVSCAVICVDSSWQADSWSQHGSLTQREVKTIMHQCSYMYVLFV